MRNRLLQHIVESVNKPNPYSASEIIAAQSGTIKRLSDAYEKLHREHNEMKSHYSRAWGYFKKVHEVAREKSNHLPFWDSVINEVVGYNNRDATPEA